MSNIKLTPRESQHYIDETLAHLNTLNTLEQLEECTTIRIDTDECANHSYRVDLYKINCGYYTIDVAIQYDIDTDETTDCRIRKFMHKNTGETRHLFESNWFASINMRRKLIAATAIRDAYNVCKRRVTKPDTSGVFNVMAPADQSDTPTKSQVDAYRRTNTQPVDPSTDALLMGVLVADAGSSSSYCSGGSSDSGSSYDSGSSSSSSSCD